ncbi:TetR/AcrR family transcriptional regulator [Demequina sp. NBRC 110056]|uniref:TetR/AcrR family transcriptional regulator n=1 Tax=Demequina sp. NBRC 110056 TaxID=1570345 RepID=UPI0009FF0D51|nr:TetR/AcrR family transcriptional regulator [Demequina sp. NBRC 110056]
MSPTRRQLPPRPETAERRRDILRAALEIFGSKGYNNGPLAEIAEQVGMTHAGILHHFGSKDRLLVEVLRYRDESDVEGIEGQHIPDGTELFRHLIRTAFANEQRPGIVQAYAVLSAESVTDGNPGREYFEERYQVLRGEVAAAFRVMCAEQGVEDPETLDHAAASILAVMDGMQVQWLLDPSNVTLAKTSAFAIEAIAAQVLDPRSAPFTAAPDSPA